MKKKVICGIYKITSPTGKIYIGQGTNILRRFVVYNSLNCKLQKRLYASFQKHGVLNHTFEIIEECLKEDLNCRERYWQDYYNVLGTNGLNCVLTPCPELNKKGEISEDKRNRLSESHKNIKPSEKSIIIFKEMINNRVKSEEERLSISNRMKGENHYFYGKKLSFEHREKISQSLKGKNKNIKFSLEHKKKLSDIRRKRIKTVNLIIEDWCYVLKQVFSTTP